MGYGGKGKSGGGGYGGGGGGYGGSGGGAGYGGGKGGHYSGKNDMNGAGFGKGASNGPREEDSVEVDDRDMGRLIGKGGSTIRDLQDGTGCRIITPNRKGPNEEPGMNAVKLLGTKDQISRCKDAISGVLMGDEAKDVLAEIDGAVLLKNIDPMSMGHLARNKAQIEEEKGITLDLDAKTARIWSKDGNREKALEAKEYIEDCVADLTTVDTITVAVPAHMVNQVINDSALRQLQDQTGMTANVKKDDEGTGIRCTGLAGAIEEAQKIIEQRVQGEGAAFLALMPGLFSRMTPKAWADLQGDMGYLQQNSGAMVELEKGSNRANFHGTPEAVRYAKREMQKILNFYFPQECCTLDLPPESVEWIAGDDDRELMRLQSGGAIAALDREAAEMWVCGNPRSVEQVRNRIRNSLERWDKEHAVINVSSKNQCFAIIGSGGSVIRELQSATGARISVDPDSCRVTLAGREESVRDAKNRIMEIIGRSGGGGKEGGGKGRQQDYQSAPPRNQQEDYAEPIPAAGGFGGAPSAPPAYAADPAEAAPAPAPRPVPGRGRGASRW